MEHAGNTFLVTKKEARALLAYTSRDQVRVNLQGIAVDPSSATLAATDGHRAIFATAPGGDPWGLPASPGAPVIPADSWGAVIKAARARDFVAVQIHRAESAPLGVAATLAVVPSHATAASLDGTDPRDAGATMIARVRLENTAPPLANVLPRYERDDDDTPPAGLIGFNPRYLAALADLGKCLHGNTPIVWRHRGELDAALAVARADDDAIWRVVIMPMRLESSSRGTLAA